MFSCGVPEPRSLVRYSALGERVRTRVVCEGSDPASSPDGRFLAFSNNGILVKDMQTGSIKKLAPSGVQPSWSADGEKIAFSRKDGIWTMEKDGTMLTKVIDEPEAKSAVWSRKGDKIAYSHNGVSIYSFDTKISRILLKNASSPSWSPVCDHILFDAWYDSMAIFSVIATNYERTELGVVTNDAMQTSWSPDGKYIVFSRTGIWIKFMEASSGGKETRITEWGANPCWSGDGKWIYFTFKGYIYKINSPYPVKPESIDGEIHRIFKMSY